MPWKVRSQMPRFDNTVLTFINIDSLAVACFYSHALKGPCFRPLISMQHLRQKHIRRVPKSVCQSFRHKLKMLIFLVKSHRLLQMYILSI